MCAAPTRVCHVLAPCVGVKISRPELRNALLPRLAVVHMDLAGEHGEDFLAIVDMPAVRLVGPVQSHGGAVHIGDVLCLPRLGWQDYRWTVPLSSAWVPVPDGLEWRRCYS